ncbi:MAG: gliding motility-associated C-terminal domain-containing protein [Prevotellaceae bacterium]|nr:gliding motility-associated C-terminal domain-containing protein [Prevotellaceae bacterium]
MKTLILSIFTGLALVAVKPVQVQAQSCVALYSTKYDTLVVGVAGSAMTLTAATVSTPHTVSMGTTAWATASTLTGGKINIRIIENNETLNARVGYVHIEYGSSCRDSVVLFQPGKTCEQGIDGTEGRRFFVAFSENIYQSAYNPPQTRLIMTAAETTPGTITNPRAGWSQTFTVPANTVIQVTVPLTQAYNTSGETVSDLGLLVTSAKKISLYASNSESTSSDATNVLPVEALGDEYYSVSYNGHRLNTATPEEFMIVATEDNTLITIVPRNQTGGVGGTTPGKAAGNPFNIRLQKGQTYLVKSYLNSANDPELGPYFCLSISGSYIKSNKLIAVFAGHKRANIGCTGVTSSTRDNLFQQLAPLRLWGTHYAVTSASLVRDKYRIVAAYDNTVFSINGTPQSPLNRSEYRDYTVMQGAYAYIESDQPVEVGFMGESQGCQSVSVGDPFLVVVNPVENEITDVTFAALPLSAILQQYVNIVVQQSAKAATTLTVAATGVPVSLTFTDIAGSNYAYARVQIANGSYRLRNSVGFTAYVYGFGNAESYAYSVGARFNHLTPPSVTADTSYCLGQPPKPLSDYDVEGNFLWYASADDENPLDTVPVITTAVPGTCTFYVSRLVECSESPRRPVTVRVYPLPALTFADTAVCAINSAAPLALPAGGSYTGAGCLAGHFYPSGAGTGTHTITYTYRDVHGCTDSASSTVTVLPLPADPTIGIVDSVSLCDGTPATLAANASGAANAQWYKNGVAMTDSTRLQLVVTESGSYSVTVTGANGCAATQGSDPVTIVMHAMPGIPAVSTTDTTTFCHGRWATLYAHSADAVAYQWYRDGIAIADSTGTQLTAVASGSYTVRITNANGCLSEMSTPPVVITTFPSPNHPAVTTADSTAFCPGGSATLFLDTTGARSWQWFHNGTAVPDSTTEHFTTAQSGTYYVIVQKTDYCIEHSEEMEITVYPVPATAAINGGAMAFCSGGSVVLTADAAGAASFQWFRNGTAVPDSVNAHFTAAESGSYTALTQDTHGCLSTISAPVEVTVYPLPATPVITVSGAAELCAGDSVKLAVAGAASYTCQWLRNGNPVPGATTHEYMAYTAGTYTLSIENEYHCPPAYPGTAVTVVVHPLPVAPHLFSADALSFCQGDDALLEANAPGAITYQWYRNGTPIALATGAACTAVISGTYTLHITDAHGCRPAGESNALPVVVYERPAAPQLDAAAAAFCGGGSTELTVIASGAQSYTWLHNGSPVATTTAPGFFVTEGGTYTVTVLGEGSCTASGAGNPVIITILNTPADPVLTVTSPTSFCQGQSVLLTAWSPDALTYEWHRDGYVIEGLSADTYAASASGQYTVRAVNGCVSQNAADPVSVTVHNLPLAPVIAANGPPFYRGWDYMLEIVIPERDVHYYWYKDGVATGITGEQWPLPALEDSQAGTYTVEAESGEGCRVRSEPFVVAPEPSPLFIPNVFTPNGDGVNDTFHIAGLENYNGNELRILNKRGKTVFSAVDYRNDWDGSGLPDDTYYYRLTVQEKDGSDTPYQGYVNIKR